MDIFDVVEDGRVRNGALIPWDNGLRTNVTRIFFSMQKSASDAEFSISTTKLNCGRESQEVKVFSFRMISPRRNVVHKANSKLLVGPRSLAIRSHARPCTRTAFPHVQAKAYPIRIVKKSSQECLTWL